jgi:plastocyanin
MVQRKKVSVAVGLVLFFTAFIFIVALNQSIFAKEQMPKETIKTVILKKDAGITPNPLEVKLGTTIVWFNNDNGPITIKFIRICLATMKHAPFPKAERRAFASYIRVTMLMK